MIHASSANHFKASIVLNWHYLVIFPLLLASCVISKLVNSVFSSMYIVYCLAGS